MEILKQIAQCLEAGDDAGVPPLVRQALAEGIVAKTVLDDGIDRGHEHGGGKIPRPLTNIDGRIYSHGIKGFKEDIFFVPEDSEIKRI